MSDSDDILNLSTELMQIITAEQAWYYSIIPIESSQGKIRFYSDRSFSSGEIAQLEMLTGKDVVVVQQSSEVVSKTLQKYYRKAEARRREPDVSGNVAAKSFIHDLLEEAANLGSSDIHIEVYESKCRIRLRIDGKLVERYIVPKNEYPGLVNRLKIMSNLDIAEKRLPQDGRIFYNEGGYQFDIRVSVLPSLNGEKMVLRILKNDVSTVDIEKLGFSENELTSYLEGVKRPNGILLISGPTGSGKTTTLYATLKLLNNSSRNILTIEDPVEYTLEGVNQVQLKESIGLDYSRALKTFLRQDPDVIMVGEIRDVETAQMAVRAALTGHLVLSTIHTNSAWGTVSRLIDMGIPPYLVASVLNTTVAQRLVRCLCEHCKQWTPLDGSSFPKSFVPYEPIEMHAIPVGCEHCFQTGYKGRRAVYEVIPVDEELSHYIKERKLEVKEVFQEKGINTMSYHAFEMLKSGETSLEEIYSLLVN